MLDTEKYDYFVSTRKWGAPFGFTTYSTEDGEVKMISYKKDKHGEPIPQRFVFTKQNRALRIPKNKKDIFGNSVSEFLRNSPECAGSPNCNGGPTYFKELREDKDAKDAVTAKQIRIEAESKALSASDEEIMELAFLYGLGGKSVDIARHRVLEQAGNDPDRFLEFYNSPDRAVRSLIRKGLKLGVLSSKGKMVIWEKTTVGNDEDTAVTALLKDEKLHKAIEEAIKSQ